MNSKRHENIVIPATIQGYTIHDLLLQAETRLQPLSQTPRLDAEILLAHCLNQSRSYLHAWSDLCPDSHHVEQFHRLLQCRIQEEPIAYLIGYQNFWSLQLRVTPDTLIPRPETELLVEQALERLPAEQPAEILDMGTGSGAIALAIASERPHARLLATDNCQKALEVATYNAARLGINQVRFLQSHWYQQLPAQPFDMIVSNPPYIDQDDDHLHALRHEPLAALCPLGNQPDDGLSALDEIIHHAPDRLKSGGWLILEHGFAQQEAVMDRCREAGLVEISGHTDLAQLPRIVCARKS